MQCLTNIVGVTTSECTCIIRGLTNSEVAELKVSKSGLYLDNLPGGVHMKELQYVDSCKTFKEMADTAISNAVKMLEDDLVVSLNNKYVKAKKTFKGEVGQKSYAGTLNNPKRYQGLRLRPYDYSDGVIFLHRLDIIVNATVNFDVQIIRVPRVNGNTSVMGDVVDIIPIEATANTYKTVSFNVPKKLPLVYQGQEVEYWVVYDRDQPGPSAFQPRDNKIQCSTCPAQKLGDFVDAKGVGFTDLSALNGAVIDNYAHGISLHVTVKCDNETLFCREYDEDDAVAVTMANAVWYKAGELLIEMIQGSPDVNRYTTMETERLWGKRNHFRKQYELRVDFAVSVIDVSASNCYVCRDVQNEPRIGTILK